MYNNFKLEGTREKMKNHVDCEDQIVEDFEDYYEECYYEEDHYETYLNRIAREQDEFTEYEDYDRHKGKKKHMKNAKMESKPEWRHSRKVEKKFKHDVLGID